MRPQTPLIIANETNGQVPDLAPLLALRFLAFIVGGVVRGVVMGFFFID